MSIEEIIQLTQNKLQNLLTNRELAFGRGDLDVVVTLDNSILITQETLLRLETLL